MFAPQKRILTILVMASLCLQSKHLPADETTLPEEISPVPAPAPSAPMTLPPVEDDSSTADDSRIFSSGPMDESAPVPSAPVNAESPLAPENTALKTVQSQPQYYSEPTYRPHSCHSCQQAAASRWISFESLLWWTSGTDIPVIATTSPNGTPGMNAGVLAPGGNGQVLFGGDEIFGFHQGGFRLRAGRWRHDCDCDTGGFVAEFLMLAPRSESFTAQSGGNPILARPFFNAATGQQDSQLLAYPGLASGALNFSADTNMYSAAVHYWEELYRTGCRCNSCGECGDTGGCGESCGGNACMLGIKIGPRFSHLNDEIGITESLTSAQTGSTFQLVDFFDTENSFLGGEIALLARRQQGQLSIDLGLQLAIGGTRQELDVSGYNSVTTAAGAVTTAPGGFFAQDSNSGSWDRTRFSLIPGLEAGLGWDFRNGWRFSAAYSLMYWTNVLRASEQIDTAVDPNFFGPGAGAGRPAPLLNESDYLAHGISIGFEKRW